MEDVIVLFVGWEKNSESGLQVCYMTQGKPLLFYFVVVWISHPFRVYDVFSYSVVSLENVVFLYIVVYNTI